MVKPLRAPAWPQARVCVGPLHWRFFRIRTCRKEAKRSARATTLSKLNNTCMSRPDIVQPTCPKTNSQTANRPWPNRGSGPAADRRVNMNGKMTLIANGAIKKAVMAATLLATAATGLMATPAMAQPGWHGGRGWHGGGGWHGRGGGDAGAVIAGGILGVAVGAAIASEHRPYYGGPAYGYYAPPPPPPRRPITRAITIVTAITGTTGAIAMVAGMVAVITAPTVTTGAADA
jgi:hypothetical protein